MSNQTNLITRTRKFILMLTLLAVALSLTLSPVFAASDPATIVVATKLTGSKFDPALHFQEMDAMDVLNLYEPLVYPSKAGPPVGHLATSWDVSDGGKVYTFKLRKGVTFHNGAPLTAEDVVYSMNRVLTIKKGYSYLWLKLLKVGATKALDKYTVQMTLNQPFAPFVDTLIQFFVVNSELVKKNTKKAGSYGENGDYGMAYLADKDAGSGPYMVESYVPNTRRSFVRYNGYWGGWKSNQFKRAVVEVIQETSTARALLEQGKVDLVDQWQPIEFYEQVKKNSKVKVHEDVDNKVYFAQMNNKKPPFDDVNFRKAILYAFDYDTAIKDIFYGGQLAHGPIPSRMPGYSANTKAYSYDPEKAKAFLAKSKYKAADYKLQCIYLKAGVHEQVMLLLQANLAAVGIDLELKTEQWPTLAGKVRKAETTPHFFPVYNTAKYPSPDAFTFHMYHPDAHGSWSAAAWYNSPRVNRIIDQARMTADADKRNSQYGEAAALIAEDAASLWVVYPIHRVATTSRIKGYDYIGSMAFDLRFYALSY